MPSEHILVASPKLGDVVTFSYESNIRRDIPVHPKIYRIRTDISWEEVMYNSLQDNKYLNSKLVILVERIWELP